MPRLDENPILDLGRTPVPGGAPSGIDAADDEGYILIQAEVSKLGRIEAGEPDWYQVEQSAVELLRSKSKDIEIASQLGMALFKRYGYAGLSASLGMLTEMVNTFWDDCFPERPRRRKARIESLADQFSEGGWFRENQPKPDDFDAIDQCVARITALEEALKARMPDEPPEFGKFIRGIKELAGRRPAAAPAPVAQASDSGAAAPSAAPPAAGAAGSFSAGEVSDVSGAVNAMLAAAAFIRKADPTDPIPYAIIRTIKWAKISLPTSDAAKFQIDPPENTTVEALTHQFSNGVWEHLLKGAEAAFRSSDPLWLDLQRYACAAMAGLGPGYEKARQAVMGVTAGLVNRLGEGLFELKFRTGMPLCSGETRMWIETEVAPPRGNAGGSDASMSNGKLTEASDKARKLAGEGKLKEAVAELREGLASCNQRRDRLMWMLAIAKLCFDSQRLQVAAPLLEECAQEIERYHIDEWEPALAVGVAQTLYRCRKAITAGQKDPAADDLRGVHESFAWLCQLDPLAALSAEPAGK